jgi:hypothetical protein
VCLSKKIFSIFMVIMASTVVIIWRTRRNVAIEQEHQSIIVQHISRRQEECNFKQKTARVPYSLVHGVSGTVPGWLAHACLSGPVGWWDGVGGYFWCRRNPTNLFHRMSLADCEEGKNSPSR